MCIRDRPHGARVTGGRGDVQPVTLVLEGVRGYVGGARRRVEQGRPVDGAAARPQRRGGRQQCGARLLALPQGGGDQDVGAFGRRGLLDGGGRCLLYT
ncbi:hypothetical protein, partial [Streptomyces sp. NRRL S-15]|uniref:hypothetical protein n=1 Tax=Streptomyces sp. NRRL S-15 TaxID=1463886 RepID=UPI001F3B71DB